LSPTSVEAVCPAESATFTTRLVLSSASGTPTIVPETSSKLNPAGRLPEIIRHWYGGAPPLIGIADRYATLTAATGIWFVSILSCEVPANALFVATVAIAVIKHKRSLLKHLGFFMLVFSPGPWANTVDAEDCEDETVFYHREGTYFIAPTRNTGSAVSFRSAVPSELRYRLLLSPRASATSQVLFGQDN
jgi:hypothetical protein